MTSPIPRSAALFAALLVCLLPRIATGFGGAPRIARSAQASATGGSQSALVIFAKFAGEAAGDDTKPSWADDLFDAGIPGSFTHFYDEMSGGRLRVGGQALPRRYASREAAAAYLAKTPGTQGDFARFNLEILARADADVDMGRFDNDGPDGVPNSGDDDGYVDIVFINLLTVPRDFLISGATGIATLGLKTDFLSDDAAANGDVIRVRSQFSGFGGTTQRGHVFRVTAATMCHEFAHVLGLPDLFDQSSVTAQGELDPAEDSAGIGKWGLMGLGTLGWGVEDGPNAFSAWSLAQLGWLGDGNERLVEVTASRRGIVLEPIDRGGRVLKIALTPDEYFLIENRQAGDSYYNRNIPAGGLLVWHVDERADNDEERHKQVDLVCADGLYADGGFPGTTPDPVAGGDNLDFWSRDAAYAAPFRGNQGDATDPFDGVRYRRFAHDTNPGARAHAGARRGVPVGFELANITALDNGRMQLDVLLGQPVAGNVVGEVTWSGTVQVTGDVVVEPQATLRLAAGTRVRFAGDDDRGSGFDPTRAELLVYGELIVDGTAGEPVRLERDAGAGREWLGVLLPGGTSRDLESDVTNRRLILEGARLGIVRSRLPMGVSTWSGVRTVPWDLLVPAGAELRIEGGARVAFAAADLAFRGRAPAHVELMVAGRLHVDGGGAEATLTVDSRQATALWAGVEILAGGAVDAEGLALSQAISGVSGQVSDGGSLRLVDARLTRLLSGLDLRLFADATIDRSTFAQITTQAVRVEGFGTLQLRSSTVEGNGREGVFASNAGLQLIETRVVDNGSLAAEDPRSGLAAEGGRGQRIEIWDSAIEGNRLHGLQFDGWEGEVELHRTSVTGNRQDGLRASGTRRVVFEDVEVDRNLGIGARLSGTTAQVLRTHFRDNVADGMLVTGGAVAVEMGHFAGNRLSLVDVPVATVRTSEFVDASVALHTQRAAPEVVGNHFEGNVTALRVEGVPVPSSIRGNTFSGNRTAIDNRSGVVLDAAGNYWGTTDSTLIAAQLSGRVDFAPFLPEPDTAVAQDIDALPDDFALLGSWPNPFNAGTVIAFELPRTATVTLVIHDVGGQTIRRLASASVLPAGRHRVHWDGRDERGRAVASGPYLYRLQAAAEFAATGRMMVLR